jgi:hypothetical protein
VSGTGLKGGAAEPVRPRRRGRELNERDDMFETKIVSFLTICSSAA